MLEIKDDNILVFTDIHVGIKSNSFLRLDIAEDLIDDIVKTIIDKEIKTVLFCGDWHHERPSLSVETMNRSIRMIKKITEHAKLYFILGNHDIRDNVTTDVNSVKFLGDIDGVTLIEKATEIMTTSNKLDMQILKLEKTYMKKISKAISPQKAFRFIQAENKIEAMINAQLASEIPLLESIE